MEFEVLPADRSDKGKRAKLYDHPDAKKGVEKTAPEVLLQPKDTQPNRAYVDLPPTILKCMPPVQVLHPDEEDQEMVVDPTPAKMKGKQREQPAVAPTPLPEPEAVLQKSKEHVSAPKEMPRFEVVNPKSSNEKMRNQLPQYRYVTELMNETNQEKVFQTLLDQPVMLKLGEVLGTSYDLGKCFQAATHSQCFPVQQAKVVNIKVLNNIISREADSDDEDKEECMELSEVLEFASFSGEARSSRASMEELHEMTYQSMMEEEYHHQFANLMREINLAHPHEYCAMVMACLSSRIGDQDYMMLVDSGSELNIMTLHQAQELALPIYDSRNSWMLKGISGHTMGLEGICWNVPVQIGGIEFSHNFFVT